MIAWALAVAVAATPPACRVPSDRRDDVAWLEAKCHRLTTAQAPRLERAQTVFETLRRLALFPRRAWLRLTVLRDYSGIHAWTTSDGTVVLSAKALALCYQNARGKPLPQADGDARIAFVLAHELAHQVHGDLPAGFLDDDLLYRKGQAAAIQNSELKADLAAIVDVARAGFRPVAVWNSAGGNSLLRQWVGGGAANREATREVKDQEQRLQKRLRLVFDNLALDEAGVLLLEVGRAEDAVTLIDAFVARAQFEGAAELNNAALARHLLALQLLAACAPRQALRFRLPALVDPDTFTATRSGGEDPLESCRRQDNITQPLARAREQLGELARSFPDYAPGHVNLVATLLTADDPASAFAAAHLALSKEPPLPPAERLLLEHLRALAQYLQAEKQGFDEPRRDALAKLRDLSGRGGHDVALAYNLARVTSELLGDAAARDLWRRVLTIEPRGPYANEARRALGVEDPDDRGMGDVDPSGSATLGPEPPVPLGRVSPATRKRLARDKKPFDLPNDFKVRVHHGTGWTAYAINDVIRLVVESLADDESVDEIVRRRGPAKGELNLPGGRRVLRYDGLAFEMRGNAPARRVFFTPL